MQQRLAMIFKKLENFILLLQYLGIWFCCKIDFPYSTWASGMFDMFINLFCSIWASGMNNVGSPPSSNSTQGGSWSWIWSWSWFLILNSDPDPDSQNVFSHLLLAMATAFNLKLTVVSKATTQRKNKTIIRCVRATYGPCPDPDQPGACDDKVASHFFP